MTAENREFARRWMNEIWNERRDETVEELMAPDAIGHVESGEVIGREPFLAYRAALLNAFPDLRITVEDTLADDESVVVRWRVNGTHQGDGLGVPPTGRGVSISGMTWFRVRDGRAVEGWDSWNMGGLIESLRT
jgi:steroid delta-isomerase-like uncharacterized protein